MQRQIPSQPYKNFQENESAKILNRKKPLKKSGKSKKVDP